jgi:hypothetical protein
MISIKNIYGEKKVKMKKTIFFKRKLLNRILKLSLLVGAVGATQAEENSDSFQRAFLSKEASDTSLDYVLQQSSPNKGLPVATSIDSLEPELISLLKNNEFSNVEDFFKVRDYLLDERVSQQLQRQRRQAFAILMDEYPDWGNKLMNNMIAIQGLKIVDIGKFFSKFANNSQTVFNYIKSLISPKKMRILIS